MLQFVSIRYH